MDAEQMSVAAATGSLESVSLFRGGQTAAPKAFTDGNHVSALFPDRFLQDSPACSRSYAPTSYDWLKPVLHVIDSRFILSYTK